MTAVTRRMLGLLMWLAALLPAAAAAQASAAAPPPGPALLLYRQLRSVGLDPAAVYRIRDAALDREDIHISLDDGTIAFTQAVDGRITGAFFEGEGEILLIPPDQAERGSLALFTGAAILEEKFSSAYFRFNDDTAAELQPWLRPAGRAEEFLEKWERTARTLSESDALRLLASFLNTRPAENPDRMLRARLQGAKLGVFDVFFDTLSGEQIAVEKLSFANGLGYYDVLASFLMRSARQTTSRPEEGAELEVAGTAAVARHLGIGQYTIRAQVQPPHSLEADALLDVKVRQGGDRLCFFELSRYLKVREVEADGRPLEFLQNEALEGTDLARRGNDVVAVVFPEPLRAGQRLQLRFRYGGTVLAEAGPGLLYVGARGIWFPNRGFAMSQFDLEFRYPAEWTLVATGKMVSHETVGEEQVSHWVSERPIPVAGFNLGKYRVESARAGEVLVQAYATLSVERSFPAGRRALPLPPPITPVPPGRYPREILVPEPPPAPLTQAQAVANTSARAVEFFARHFGPFPYGRLALSQFPGRSSQGWPGLVFLSSYAFLSPEERTRARLSPFESLLFNQFMLVHETAHQWWGDLVIWKSYRDQWLVEALSNYSAVLALEKDRAADCKALLEQYRGQLLSKTQEGERVADAGAVTLGFRLTSSHFANGFDAVSYGRGTWLLHMLRHMLRDTTRPAASRGPARGGDEPFLRALRKLRERYEGREISHHDFQQVLEEELPDSLRWEGKKSLDWFFEGWVNGTAIPHLELKDVKFSRQAAGAVATGMLLQKEAPERLVTSVPLYAQTTGGLVFVGRVFADGSESTFRVNVPPDTRKLVLDPYQTVLTRP